MKVNHTLLIVLLAAGIFYLWRYQHAPDITIAELSVSDESNQTQPLQALLTDSSVVLFYASWCGPCLKELRTLKNSLAPYDSAGVHFYCITDDSPEKIAVMRANMPTSMRFLHIASLKEAGIYSIPATYFLLHRNVIDKMIGAPDWQQSNERIRTFKNT